MHPKATNMKYIIHLVTQYTLSSLLIAVIWILCFFTPPHTPLDHVNYMDKWTHVVMYFGTCTIIWIQYLKQHKQVEWGKAVTLAWLAPILMSGIIEFMQANCTGGRRSGEWADFAANAIGGTLALLIGILLAKKRAR